MKKLALLFVVFVLAIGCLREVKEPNSSEPKHEENQVENNQENNNPNVNEPNNHENQRQNNQSDPDQPSEPNEGEIARLHFLQQTTPSSRNTFNTELTNHYGGIYIPKTTIVQDDCENRRNEIWSPTVVVKLSESFCDNLPEVILAELNAHEVSRSNVDIFFNVQWNRVLGETRDHRDGSPQTSRLKAHGWADPDAPASYFGTRVNRNFLFGIYETDLAKIGEEEIKVGELRPFPMHTHDNLFSPRTASIRLGSRDPSQSFYSLVIDNNNPEGINKANVTLHWVLTYQEKTTLRDLTKTMVRISPTGWRYQWDIRNLAEMMQRLNSSEYFRGDGVNLLGKLNDLMLDDHSKTALEIE